MKKKDKQALRQSLRERRKSLTHAQQVAAAAALFDLVSRQDFFLGSHRIAFYKKHDGEIDPQPLLRYALNSGKLCYLPVISGNNSGQLAFAAVDNNTQLTGNQWGIDEPPLETTIAPQSLDVVFVPLTGFSDEGYRLGMGKGFYDKTFAFRLTDQRARPALVGLAHDCQLLETVPATAQQAWDVPMDIVVTPSKIYRPGTA
ncbi:MAG: 5-formyltetrahydrofolate cyclo-ligase [Gammaproteobacteria bacterium]|nr:5-formyltetrahydrofolate cyclo-ligase [Gammaproteobacteria bacterium]MCY4358774.1 5-formyltetrahydrofolate cyclo-ligase [Gammaproteobacteria bacterium]